MVLVQLDSRESFGGLHIECANLGIKVEIQRPYELLTSDETSRRVVSESVSRLSAGARVILLDRHEHGVLLIVGNLNDLRQ